IRQVAGSAARAGAVVLPDAEYFDHPTRLLQIDESGAIDQQRFGSADPTRCIESVEAADLEDRSIDHDQTRAVTLHFPDHNEFGITRPRHRTLQDLARKRLLSFDP